MSRGTHKLSEWVFRFLVIAATILMILSFTMPWWKATFTIGFSSDTSVVNVYGWGLRHSLTLLASYVTRDVTPLYQTILAWIYIGTIGSLAIVSTWVKGIKGQLLLAGTANTYILYAAISVFVVISNRVSHDNIPLQGATVIPLIEQMDFITVQSSLQPGYYLAYVAAGLLIILAMLRTLFFVKVSD
jgi:hypothetical protein